MLSQIEDDRQTDIPEQELLAERSHTETDKYDQSNAEIQMLKNIWLSNTKKEHIGHAL